MDDEFAALLERLDEAGLQPWEVLSLSVDDVARRVRVSAREIESFRARYERDGAEPPLTTIESGALSTQMPELDELLGAGLRRAAITEVCGAAGVGKTCFCCQMALCAEAAVYIATEDNIRIVQRRMRQLAPRYGAAERALARVRFVQVRTLAELRVAVFQAARAVPAPALVVLDSVAALAPSGVAHFDAAELDDTLGLRRLCAERGCAVLVANQVRDRVGLEHRTIGPVYEFEQQEHMHGDPRLRAALGPAWAARMDARLLLCRTGRHGRTAVLVFSKWAPYGSLPMQMTETGLQPGAALPDDFPAPQAQSQPMAPISQPWQAVSEPFVSQPAR